MFTTTNNLESLKEMLLKHEGLRLRPYTDTTGHLTIGIGRNLTDRGLMRSEAFDLLNNDINYFMEKLEESLPYFHELSDARIIVLVDMCFNLGVKGLLGFKRMLNFIEKKDWTMASFEILKSKAASQAPNRYKDLATIMRTGLINKDN